MAFIVKLVDMYDKATKKHGRLLKGPADMPAKWITFDLQIFKNGYLSPIPHDSV